jgi:hypothetical protein
VIDEFSAVHADLESGRSVCYQSEVQCPQPPFVFKRPFFQTPLLSTPLAVKSSRGNRLISEWKPYSPSRRISHIRSNVICIQIRNVDIFNAFLDQR